MNKLPLEGVRVVDVTGVWAGPYATQMLADWGAEDIWVESRQMPSRGYSGPEADYSGIKGRMMTARPNREGGERPWNRNPITNAFSRNKLNMTVNLSRPEGKDIFKRLVKVSDVVIENRGPGTMDKLGIGYQTLKQVKPDIIMVSMPGFGLTGPYRDFRSWGAQLENFCGQALLMGYRDTNPTEVGFTYYTDAVGGAMGALAVLMALHYRQQTGEGQFIELSQIESLIPQFGDSIMSWTLNQNIQGNLGNRHSSAIQGCYRCRGEDRWVNITINTDDEWEGFCRALGKPSWCEDEKFNDTLNRYKNHDKLDGLIEAWTSQRDNYEVMNILQKEGVPAGPVMDERDCYADPQLEKREFFQEVFQVDCGTHRYPGIVGKMSKTPNKIRTAPPLFGEHNEYVYKKIIGVSDEEYAELEKAGHIGMDYDLKF